VQQRVEAADEGTEGHGLQQQQRQQQHKVCAHFSERQTTGSGQKVAPMGGGGMYMCLLQRQTCRQVGLDHRFTWPGHLLG
jgi:hypothetical protein